jgi:ABC-2 type transport system ATP-binding protein
MVPVVEFRNVTKVYRRRFSRQKIAALSDVTFEVHPGEVCAFLGPNGAGKTTAISILMGFFYPDSGEIRVLGYEPGDVRAKRQIGFLPENFAFYQYLDAESLLNFHCVLAERTNGDRGGIIHDLLTKVRLEQFKGLKISKYSRGMVQRLGVAQALLGDPKLLVLDEPTSGLDPAGRKDVRDLISSLRAAGNTIFLSSHILSEVEQICDRAVIIDRGRVVRAGTMNELLVSSGRVEIVVNQLPEAIETTISGWNGSVERSARGVKIIIAEDRKREAIETVWFAGGDVISLMPIRGSLEELFLNLVGGDGGVA